MNEFLRIFFEHVQRMGVYNAILMCWEYLSQHNLDGSRGSFVTSLSNDELLECAVCEAASQGIVAQNPIVVLIDRKLPFEW